MPHTSVDTNQPSTSDFLGPAHCGKLLSASKFKLRLERRMASNDHPPPPAKRAKILREGRLENKVVFITAAAQGIGRASALVSRRGT